MSADWEEESSQQVGQSYGSSGDVFFRDEIPSPVRRNRTVRPTVTVMKKMALNSQGELTEPLMSATLFLYDQTDGAIASALFGNDATGWISDPRSAGASSSNQASSSSRPDVYQIFEFPNLKVRQAGSNYCLLVTLTYQSGQYTVVGGHAYSSYFDSIA